MVKKKTNPGMESPVMPMEIGSLLAELKPIKAINDKDTQKKTSDDKKSSDRQPKARKVKKMEDKNPLDLARTWAWLSAIKRVCAKEGEPLPSANILKKLDWAINTGTPVIPNFDRFEKGKEIPEPSTIQLVDDCLYFCVPSMPPRNGEPLPPKDDGEPEAKKKKRLCGMVFNAGPEGFPLWNMAGTEPDLAHCTYLLNVWFVHVHEGLGIDASNEERSKADQTPLGPKLSALLTHFIGERTHIKDETNRVDYRAYDEGHADNVAFRLMREKGKYPTIFEFTVILAAAHLAEDAKIGRSIARYLLDFAVLCVPKMFSEYDCCNELTKILVPRQKITDSALIAQIDFLRETKWAAYPELRKKLPVLVDHLEKTPYLEMTTSLTRDKTLAAIPILFQVARSSENL